MLGRLLPRKKQAGPMRIATRIILYLFTLIAVASAGLGYVSIQDERDHLLTGIRSEARLMARSLAAVLRFYHPRDPAVDLDALLANISPREWTPPPMLRFYDRDGAPIGVACADCNPLPLPRKRIDLHTLEADGREEFFATGVERFFSIIVPVKGVGDARQGALEVVLPLAQVNQALAGTTRRFLFFTVALAAGLGALILLIARWNITQPIRRLIAAARQLGAGDFGARIDPSGVVELDNLSDELNRMAEQLEELDAKRNAFYREKLQLEKGLRHAEKLASIGQLSSGLAHEIGTPLNVISGRAEYLLAKLGQEDAARKSLTTIVRQSEQIAALIERLLSFSRMEAQGFAPLHLRQPIEEAFSLCLLRSRRGRDDIALELEAPEDRLDGDADALRQLFVNLILNSFQAIEGSGTIRIRVAGEGPDRLQICYEDSGPGIPEELRSRIFDPFFTTKQVGEGTGLGLFIVANIVEEHEGGIEVDTAPGGGARFLIRLPHRRTGEPTPEEEDKR
jgi:signal transduction histidine kinase